MAYRIDYGSGDQSGAISKKRRYFVFGAVALILISVLIRISGYHTYLIRLMLPGDPEVTALALDTLIQQLKEGSGLRDALTTFCAEIIQGATVY